MAIMQGARHKTGRGLGEGTLAPQTRGNVTGNQQITKHHNPTQTSVAGEKTGFFSTSASVYVFAYHSSNGRGTGPRI